MTEETHMEHRDGLAAMEAYLDKFKMLPEADGWMAAIWEIRDGRLRLIRLTAHNFPLEDRRTAESQLAEVNTAEIQRALAPLPPPPLDLAPHLKVAGDNGELVDSVPAEDMPVPVTGWADQISTPGKGVEPICDNPWHNNSGLIIPCPSCGAGSEDEEPIRPECDNPWHSNPALNRRSPCPSCGARVVASVSSPFKPEHKPPPLVADELPPFPPPQPLSVFDESEAICDKIAGATPTEIDAAIADEQKKQSDAGTSPGMLGRKQLRSTDDGNEE